MNTENIEKKETGITNAKLNNVAMVLNQIAANPHGSARLKWGVALNLTKIEGPVMALEKVATIPLPDDKEWGELRQATINEHCLKDDKGKPVIVGQTYQFDNNPAFHAMLDAIHREKFPKNFKAKQERDENYKKLLDEKIDIADFPYVINYDFIEIDDQGSMRGITGTQLFVLMSAGLFKGEPPWLADDWGEDDEEDEDEPPPSSVPAPRRKTKRKRR